VSCLGGNTQGIVNRTDWIVRVVPGGNTGHSKQDRLESNGSVWEETLGIVNSTNGSVMIVPGGNTQGIVNRTDWRVMVVPGTKHWA
jgi:hypothetical protein